MDGEVFGRLEWLVMHHVLQGVCENAQAWWVRMTLLQAGPAAFFVMIMVVGMHVYKPFQFIMYNHGLCDDLMHHRHEDGRP